MKYYIIAGEASGDLHASNLMKELKKKDPQAEFRFWGGDLMQAQGGKLVKHYRELAFMGFAEVLMNLRTILGNISVAKQDIESYKPDAVILVEGVSEETYLRYEIDRHPILKYHHIKVYRIDGAYAHQFISLLELLNIKTIIFTDLDLKRTEDEMTVDIKDNDVPNIIPSNISDLAGKYAIAESSLTTNGTLQYFIKKELSDENAEYSRINSKLIEMLTDKEELIVEYKNVSAHSQYNSI